MPLYFKRCLIILLVVSQTFEKYIYLIPAIVFKKYLCKSIIDDNGKKYSCKSTIDDNGLMGKEIHMYKKFMDIIELNNI